MLNLKSFIKRLFNFRDAFESIKTGKDRSLSKIRHDMLGKPMEGIIDTNISSAFDVANICVSKFNSEPYHL